LAGRLGPLRAEAAAEVLAALKREPISRPEPLAEALAAMADEGACKEALAALGEAAPTVRTPPHHFGVAQAMASLSPWMDDEGREAWLVLAGRGFTDYDPNHTALQYRDMADAAVRVGGSPSSLARFALAHFTAARALDPRSAPLLRLLDEDGLRRMLRHACCVGPSRAVVLAECARRAERPLPTLWDAVDWLDGVR
ncbi:MAG: hypothetical protein K2W96_27060, partial [Gemmataceae bacterium]|nr:hypothetical protein [Gemmataceae bacterium]